MKGLGKSIKGTQTKPIRRRTTERVSLVWSDPMKGEPFMNPPLRGMLIIVLMIEGARLSYPV